MNKREKQYTDWQRFWRKRKPVFATNNGNGVYTATLTFGRVRIPDTMLKNFKRADPIVLAVGQPKDGGNGIYLFDKIQPVI